MQFFFQDILNTASIAMRSKKCVDLMRKVHPGPSLSTVQKATNFIYVEEGFIKPLELYIKHMQQKPDWKPNHRFCTIAYDHMGLVDRADLDPKLQKLIGPAKKALVVTVRGIFAPWKFPIYSGLDKNLTKDDIIEIVKWLYNLNLMVLLTVCDQGKSLILSLAFICSI